MKNIFVSVWIETSHTNDRDENEKYQPIEIATEKIAQKLYGLHEHSKGGAVFNAILEVKYAIVSIEPLKFAEEEVEAAIARFSGNKYVGVDDIPNKTLHELAKVK